MKFCPTCQTRYDEEILRFCTKDGTPLIAEDQPSFTELPSESAAGAADADDDFNEVTVIRRNAPPAEVEPAAPAAAIIEETQPLSSPPQTPRIVIPMVEEKKPPVVLPTPPVVQAKTVTEYRVQPKKTNTAKIVLITMLGVITALGAAVFLLMSGDSNRENDSNQNTGANFNQADMNLNSNLYIGNQTANFGGAVGNTNLNANFNSNLNTNLNINAGVNAKTPTPRPTTTPNSTPPPVLNTNINISNSSQTPTPANTRPSATPTVPPPPPSTPTPPPASDTPSNSNRAVNAGVLNGRAVNLPKPAYPPIARQMRASGQVAVQIIVDEAGNVTAAKATTGNQLLRAPAEAAARQSKINPIKIGDRSVQAVGILLYNFKNP